MHVGIVCMYVSLYSSLVQVFFQIVTGHPSFKNFFVSLIPPLRSSRNSNSTSSNSSSSSYPQTPVKPFERADLAWGCFENHVARRPGALPFPPLFNLLNSL